MIENASPSLATLIESLPTLSIKQMEDEVRTIAGKLGTVSYLSHIAPQDNAGHYVVLIEYTDALAASNAAAALGGIVFGYSTVILNLRKMRFDQDSQ